MPPRKRTGVLIAKGSSEKRVDPVRWEKFRCNKFLGELEMAELRLMRRIFRQLERLNNSTRQIEVNKQKRDYRYECTCFCILGIVVVLSIFFVVLKAIESMSSK